jgi:hypothetical protein
MLGIMQIKRAGTSRASQSPWTHIAEVDRAQDSGPFLNNEYGGSLNVMQFLTLI